MQDSFTLPAHYGFARLTIEQLKALSSLFDHLAIYELPRKRGPRKYVIGVDVSDGIGKDRSVIAVHRQGTIEEPEEQVAIYITDRATPQGLAYLVDAIGRLYLDEDGVEALVAIETNGHGLSTHDVMALHLGYPSGCLYTWEFLDSADPSKRWSTKSGWVTTPRTRPLLLDKLYHSLTTRDPVTGQTELLVHSTILLDELADLQTETSLGEAEAARGAHDDACMATAIAHYVSFRMQGGEQEPLDERRRRHHEEQAARALAAGPAQPKRDWRNTGCTTEEQTAQVEEGDDSVYDELRGEPIYLD